MAEFQEDVTILIGSIFYLFGLALSAIVTILSFVQIIVQRNLKGFLLLMLLFGTVITAYTFFSFETYISLIATMMILLSARILALDKPTSKTLAICIFVMSFAALTIVASISLQYQNSHMLWSLIVFIFMLMTPAILTRLSIRSFPGKT